MDVVHGAIHVDHDMFFSQEQLHGLSIFHTLPLNHWLPQFHYTGTRNTICGSKLEALCLYMVDGAMQW